VAGSSDGHSVIVRRVDELVPVVTQSLETAAPEIAVAI
jgi:hypothetical protein